MVGGGSGADRIDQLDALRAVAMLLVVGIHAHAYAGLAAADQRTWLWFTISAAGVPTFFLVDGFLFAARRAATERFNFSRYLKETAQRLLVPWSVFSALYVAARAVAEARQFTPDRILVGKSPLDVAACFLYSCAALQMYFLLSLFLVRCLAPLTRQLVRAPAWITLAVFAIATLGLRWKILDAYRAHIPAREAGDPFLLALWGLQFYLFGVVLSRYATGIRSHKTALLTISTSLVFAAWRSPVGGAAVAQYAYLLALFVLFFGLRDAGWLLPRIGRETMGIYLLHTPVLMNGITRLASSLVGNPYTLFAVVTAACFLAALGLSLAISRTPLAGVLFGRFESRSGGVL